MPIYDAVIPTPHEGIGLKRGESFNFRLWSWSEIVESDYARHKSMSLSTAGVRRPSGASAGSR